MRDKCTEISSEAYDHKTFMMAVLGGALIRFASCPMRTANRHFSPPNFR
jgi:hypothetical protein